MQEGQPSTTAERVALRRAAHQLLDAPLVFDDPIAMRIIGAAQADALRADPEIAQSPLTTRLRAFMAARSRYAEDLLRSAVEHGTAQYVILGAGLDTFAYRNPYADRLRVFEVDYPATQAWKRARLRETGLALPPTLTFAPVDFESQTLADGLTRAGFDGGKPAFFSWLGVTPYLVRATVLATLGLIGHGARGNEVVFDYAVSPESLTPLARRAFEVIAHRVRAAGEPFQTFFMPEELARELRAVGFTAVGDLGQAEINARYFAGRNDGLMVGSLGHLLHARV